MARTRSQGGAALLEPPTGGSATDAGLAPAAVPEPAAGDGAAPRVAEPTVEATFVRLAITTIAESPHNPRKHFDPEALAELAASIREKGVLEPVTVRPHASGHGVYELASGHRRLRAARAAGLTELPAFVRPMDDATFIEMLTIANLQREDVHPLEEGDAYAEMITTLRYDVATIARKVGKSERYVYDRLKLRTLTPEVRSLFFAARITPAHAIELSRLDADTQRRAIHPATGGLWEGEAGDWDPRQEDLALADATDPTADDPYAGHKPRTVRELKQWIHDHVRFDAAAADPVLFPEAVTAVQQAQAEALRVVQVTYNHYVQEEARAADGTRTLGPRSWKPAGTRLDAADCAHAVLGVIVVGPGQGTTLPVCLAKDRCATHWGREIRERKKAAKQRAAEGESRSAPREQPWEREKRLRDEAIARVEPAIPAITDALEAAVRKAKATADGPLGQLLLDAGHGLPKVVARFPKGRTAEELVRYLAWDKVATVLSSQYRWASGDLARLAKRLGVDLAKLVKQHATPAAKPAANARATSAAKPKARSAGRPR